MNFSSDTFTTNATSVNINKLMDFIMIHAGDWIEQSDFFPIILESYTEKLEDPDAWFKLTAELISTNGLLSHLTTVVRSGNAIMSYDKSNSWLRIKTSASIRQISVSTLMNLMLLWLVNSVIVSAL